MIWQRLFPGLLETRQVCDGIFAVRDIFVNFYVLKTARGLICIDTGWSAERCRSGFETLGMKIQDVTAVYLTHLHWDHARNLKLFPGADVFLGEHEFSRTVPKWFEQLPNPVTKVHDNQELSANNVRVRVLETPGHTAGSVTYLVENRFLFTGDALRLRRGEVRPFYFCFNGNHRAVIHSIKKLANLEEIECLLTAHTGFTCDVAKAFGCWREFATGAPLPKGERA